MKIDSLRRARRALAWAALWAVATCAHADATLDKIKQRNRIVVGVMISGGPFGAIDPTSQRFVGWNPELARDLARKLGVEPHHGADPSALFGGQGSTRPGQTQVRLGRSPKWASCPISTRAVSG